MHLSINTFPENTSIPSIIFMSNHMHGNAEGGEIMPSFNSHVSSRTINILLADDDADDRELFKEAVGEAPIKTTLRFAEDGKSLIDILNHEKVLPDLLFLDLNMPHKSGLECLIEIRKDPRLKNIPVIIYSTSSSAKDIDDTFEKGANLYVKKPCSFQELRIITSKVLSLNWEKYKPHSSPQQFLYSSKTE